MKIGYDCGHAVNLIFPGEAEPATTAGAWALVYPVINEHPVEIGDNMTCVVCDEVRVITKIYAEVQGDAPD